MLKKKSVALICALAFTVCGTVSVAGYTLTGTGYVITNETVNVVVPSTLDFTLDPLEINGRGTVFSEEYPLVNMGATDVILAFTDIDVIFGNDTDFAMSDVPIDPDEIGGLKKAYLVLDFGNPDIAPIVLTDKDYASPPEIVLKADFKENAEYALRITGSISAYPEDDWNTGDVSISLTYQLNSAALEESAESEESTRIEEAAPPEETIGIEAPAETPTAPEAPAQTEEPSHTEEPAQTEEPPQTGESIQADEPIEVPEEAARADPPDTEEDKRTPNEKEDVEDVIGE